MGYTTDFTGAIELGRKLTMAEAKELLDIATSDEAEKITGIDAYFQWVPSDDLQHIVWDGNEKFYKYKEQLAWLCGWLAFENGQYDRRWFVWRRRDKQSSPNVVPFRDRAS